MELVRGGGGLVGEQPIESLACGHRHRSDQPLRLAQFVHPDLAALQKRVTRTRHHREAILDQRYEAPALGRHAGRAAEGDVHFIAFDQRRQSHSVGFARLYQYLGVPAAELRQRLHQNAGYPGRDCGNAHGSRGTPGHRHHLFGAGFHCRQNAAGRRQQRRTDRRRAHAPGVAQEQFTFEQRLEISERVCHGRLRQPDRLGRALDAAEFGDLDKHLQVTNARAGDQAIAQGGSVGAHDIRGIY